MKAYNSIKFAIIMAACVMCSCAGTGSKDKAAAGVSAGQKDTRLISKLSPVYGMEFKQGSSFDVTCELAGGAKADSIVLDMAGKRIGKLGENGYRVDLSRSYPVGGVKYRITAYKDGLKESRTAEFTVLPLAAPVMYGYRVVRTFNHDPEAYTQGLLWDKGHLYESTGLLGGSSLRRTELSGKVIDRTPLNEDYFGEGLALLGGKFYQLTWQNGKILVYDAATLKQTAEIDRPGEGWGLTTDGKDLYLSDGTEKIYVLDPQTFKKVRTIEVYTDRKKVQYINEMEWINGEIWANIYTTDTIIRIDPQTGAVKGVVDMHGLLSPSDRTASTDVLNGIAYDKAARKIYVTGKNWPKLFEIEVFKK